MGDIARLSTYNENALYKALGINAELLIDHAWGFEPTDIATIKSYRPESSSLSSGPVLREPYTVEKAKLIVREMTELLVLDLVRKGVVTKQMTLTLGYDRTSIKILHDKPRVYVIAKNAGEDHPTLTFTVFVPDKNKSGGSYVEITDTVKRVDEVAQVIVLMSTEGYAKTNRTIEFRNIAAIHGELVEDIYDE